MAKKKTTKSTEVSSKPKVNKSQVIRDYYKRKPTAKPLEIVKALGKRGITVSAQQVSTTRMNAIKQGILQIPGSEVKTETTPRKRRGRPKGSTKKKTKPATSKSATTFSVDELLQAKTLVEKMGGLENARQAINALDKILG